MNYNLNKNTDHVFCFLEIFASEGGIQSYIKDILKAYQLVTQGDSTPKAKILLLRDSPECKNPYQSKTLNFDYLKTNPAWLGRIRFATKLLICLIKERPKRVFCGHIKLAPLIQAICQSLGIPYTVITYGKEIWEPLPDKYQKALREADTIWTISRYTRDRACETNNLNPQKFQLLPCTVDGNIFTPGPKPQHLIERYNLADAKVLMTVARLWSGDIYKGVDVTIRALPLIAQVFPNVKYLVVGRGDDRPRLAKLATDLGVGDRVVFAGFVAKEELVEHYRVADAYVMPSQEGFGIVYLEAIACGIPVLAGDADGSADPLQDGMLGWRVPHRDSEAVAAACCEILTGEDKRCVGVASRRHREWLRKETLAAFGTDTFTQRVKQVLSL
ncbi:MAG TPA: glycosyltransferase [Kamptonema sp.]|nr:glycosyltransferase [Kamptonema sp.]